MTGDTTVRVGVVGAGMMGVGHATCVSQSPLGELVAVADLDVGRATALAEPLGVASYATQAEFLAKDDIDAVIVCTPDWAHREVCVEAASAGKHVLVEKPLAMTLPDCDAIIKACDVAGVTLMVGHILRFDPRYSAVRSSMEAGDIGDVSYLYARRSNKILQPRRFQGRTTVLHYLAVHDVDWMLWALAEPVAETYARASRKALTDLAVDDSVFLTLAFESGAVGCIQVAWILPEQGSVDLDAYLEVVGTRGALVIDTPNAGVRMESERSRRLDTTYGFAVGGRRGGALREEVNHFLQCVRDGSHPIIGGRQARAAVAVIAAAQESIATGRPVRVTDDTT
jgi:UDP-N-acetylglucosamine 3-dehydrogenase